MLVFFRHDEYFTFGLTEKVKLQPAGGPDGRLMPCAWYFDALDKATGQRIADIVGEVTGC